VILILFLFLNISVKRNNTARNDKVNAEPRYITLPKIVGLIKASLNTKIKEILLRANANFIFHLNLDKIPLFLNS
jgi:hypothetical protein